MKEKTVGASKGWQRFKTCSQKHIVVDDYCSTLLQPEVWQCSMRWERSTKWLMPVPFLVRNPIFSTDWLGIYMALKSKTHWKENSRKRCWLQRSKYCFLLQMTPRPTVSDSEWCRPFGPVLCIGAVPFPFLSGTIRGRILGFSFGPYTLQFSEVLCFQGTPALKWELHK